MIRAALLALLISPLLAPGALADGPDFSAIPPATSVAESEASFDARANAVLEWWAAKELGNYAKDNAVGFGARAYAKLALGTGIEEVNRAFLSPSAVAYSLVGTDFKLGPFCKRNGDYDFMLQGLMPIAYRFWGEPGKLWPETKRKLLDVLLTARGAEHHLSFKLGICGKHDDTENHVLMTETSRYLTNQLLYDDALEHGRDATEFDNERNGFNRWFLRHLKQFVVRDFDEYNSRPYQGYTTGALTNLASYARDARVRTAATIVLDYLAGKFASQAIGLRRSVPFRRQPVYRDEPFVLHGDGEIGRYGLLAGGYDAYARLPEPYQPAYGSHFMLNAAAGLYRVPDLILDLMVDRRGIDHFQRFLNESPHLSYASESFLISAGGRFMNRPDLGTGERDGWSAPTVLIPAAGGWDRREFLRFDGHKKEKKRANLCVAPGFACGVNPVIPDSIPESCRERTGPWTFIDLTAPRCPLDQGFYAAVYTRPCDHCHCKAAGASYGFMEAMEAGEMSFAEFREGVLARNGTRDFPSTKPATYVTARGATLAFRVIPKKKNHWNIESVDGTPQDVDTRRWPLAAGDFLSTDGAGLIVIGNRRQGRALVLDYGDADKPSRYVIRYP